MSYGIVRVQKMTAGSVKGIEIHDRREKDGVSHTNKDIDWERTKQNYDLHPTQNISFTKAVKQRISELDLKKAVRKDAVVMVQVLVTSDSSFFEELSKDHQEQFFKDSYNFLLDRYGKENIISATVHMDERTPHMHFNFLPVTEDGRLSAKQIFRYKTDLSKLHDDFYKQIGKEYGLERGIQGSNAKHLNVAEYKACTALQEARSIEASLLPLRAEYEAKRAFLEHVDRSVELTCDIKANKSLIGDTIKSYTVPKDIWESHKLYYSQVEAHKKSVKVFDEYLKEFKNTASSENVINLQNEIRRLRHEKRSLEENYKNKVFELDKEFKEVTKEKEIIKSQLIDIKDILDSNPELKELFEIEFKKSPLQKYSDNIKQAKSDHGKDHGGRTR